MSSYLTKHQNVPTRPSQLFEDYISAALREAVIDEEVNVGNLTTALQRFAFRLTNQDDASLSGTKGDLLADIEVQNLTITPPLRYVDVATRSKLLIETRRPRDREPRFAFAHRRVQEFFATQHVLVSPDILPPRTLVRDPRWRETAVAYLQVADPDAKAPYLAELLAVLEQELKGSGEQEDEFSWTPAGIHTLELIVAAFGTNPADLPGELSAAIGSLCERAWADGTLSDRKLVADCLPALPAEQQPELISDAFSGQSDWIRMVALRNCSTLHPLPTGLDRAVRRLLITLLAIGRLSRDTGQLDSDLRRLYEGTYFVRLRKALALTPIVVLLICLLHVAYDYGSEAIALDIYSARFELLWWVFIPFAVFWLVQSSQPLSYRSSTRVHRFFGNVMRRGLGWQIDLPTEVFAILLVGMVTWAAVVDVGVGVFDLVDGQVFRGAGDVFIRPVFAAYALAWGPVMLIAVDQRWLSRSFSPIEAALVFRKAWPSVQSRVGKFARPLLQIYLRTFAVLAVITAATLGLLYALDHLVGHWGTTMATGLRWLFLGLFPLIIMLAIVRELRAWLRVRRQTRLNKELSDGRLLQAMVELTDAEEVSAFLEVVRAKSSTTAPGISRAFVRRLMRLIESVDPEVELEKKSANTDPTLGQALEDGRLTIALLTSWRGSVLDELGRLDALLRAR